MLKLITAFFILLIIGIWSLSTFLTPNDLKNCDRLPNLEAPCEKADAIVAISGGNTSDRAKEAIELYKLGWANKLIFSGAAKDTSGPSNAEAMRIQAISLGVPSSDILIETFAQTTKENATKTTNVFIDNSIHDVILVTSPYHQRRASLEFNAAVGDEVAIRNHPTTYDEDWSEWWWLSPRGWWLAGGEVVKIMAFYAGQSE